MHPARSFPLSLVALGMLAACDRPALTDALPPALTLAVVSGDGQTGDPGAELPEPLVVAVRDARDRPVKDQLVVFRVLEGGGSLFAGTGISDKNGLVRDWWTLGSPGGQVVEARAVNPSTGEKQVFATFHATAVGPPADPLAGTWRGTRPEGWLIEYVFTALNRVEINPITGNPGAAYSARYTVVSPPGDRIGFIAWREGNLVYWGITSRAQITGPNTMMAWSADVAPFLVVRQ